MLASRLHACLMFAALVVLGAWSTLAPGVARAEDEAPVVAAASSLTDVLDELGQRYAAETGSPAPTPLLAGSSRLARQLVEGAPADLVITANPRWMDELHAAGVIAPESRRDLLHNALVVVIPAGSQLSPVGPEALADPRFDRVSIAGAEVPAGTYARQALQYHGLLDTLQPRFIDGTSVRATLALVAKDEADVGFVYRTDARVEPGVRVAFRFDDAAHSPIVYPVALTRSGAASAQARAFHAWLGSPSAIQIFESAGFDVLSRDLAPAPSAPAPAERPRVEVEVWAPLLRSVFVAIVAVGLSVVPAVLLGTLLARARFFGKSLLTTALMVPLVLPPVVTGYGLLKIFGRSGLLSPVLGPLGIDIAFTRWGAVIAAAVVGFPLLILMVRGAIEAVDPRHEQIARTLGRHPIAAWLQVTLPMALPGIIAGCVLAFARALGEFGATAVLAGDIPGETRTLALAVYALYEQPGGEGAANWLSAISVVLCLVALLGYERLVRIQRRRVEER